MSIFVERMSNENLIFIFIIFLGTSTDVPKNISNIKMRLTYCRRTQKYDKYKIAILKKIVCSNEILRTTIKIQCIVI